MEHEVLPLGSIVLLKGGKKKVMIIGYRMRVQAEPDKIYDYCGCVFPEGVLRSNITCVFNKDQIAQIFFFGYKNTESNNFITRVKDLNKQEEITKNQVLHIETLESE